MNAGIMKPFPAGQIIKKRKIQNEDVKGKENYNDKQGKQQTIKEK